MVDDRERAHNALTRHVGGTHEAYKADAKDPVYLERVVMVNNLYSWIKRYFWRFVCTAMRYLQSHLNCYAYLFRDKQSRERCPKTARVVRHILMAEAR